MDHPERDSRPRNESGLDREPAHAVGRRWPGEHEPHTGAGATPTTTTPGGYAHGSGGHASSGSWPAHQNQPRESDAREARGSAHAAYGEGERSTAAEGRAGDERGYGEFSGQASDASTRRGGGSYSAGASPPFGYADRGNHGGEQSGYGQQRTYAQGGYGEGSGFTHGGYGAGGATGYGATGGVSGAHSSGYAAPSAYGEGRYTTPASRASWGGPSPAGAQRRRGPKSYKRSDERIKEDIYERLIDHWEIDSTDVSVDVQDGRVKLEGSVPERAMKHRIEDLVDSVYGVQDIDNFVRVARPHESDVGTSSVGSAQHSGASSSAAAPASSSRERPASSGVDRSVVPSGHDLSSGAVSGSSLAGDTSGARGLGASTEAPRTGSPAESKRSDDE